MEKECQSEQELYERTAMNLGCRRKREAVSIPFQTATT
jgi:hypothetical protein